VIINDKSAISEHKDWLVNRDFQLKKLLTRDLPLQRVGPHLRHGLKRALNADDPDTIRDSGRAVALDLIRRGELLRVSIQGDDPDTLRFCLIKGTRELVDLTPLWVNGGGGDPVPSPSVGAGRGPLAPGSLPQSFQAVSGFLGAMERAQDLQIADVQSGETATILGNILGLLAGFTPQFKLAVLLHSIETPGKPGDPVFGIEPGEAALGWIGMREQGHSVWIPSPQEFPGRVRMLMESDPDWEEPYAGVAVPLWEPSNSSEAHDRHEAGLLFVVGETSWGRDPLLKLAARLSRFVTNRWRHQRDVNQKIHTDALTGVCNRAFFDTQFTLELERARRSESPLTLVIADLDHFKSINDTYGHQAGDCILRMVARRLLEELRRIDHVCRIGGEEFALILPATNQAAAQDVLARLLRTDLSEEVRVEGRKTLIKATFSYGAVTFPDAGTDAFELYRKADAMLFLSKDLGRNQCHFWSSEGEHFRLNPPAS